MASIKAISSAIFNDLVSGLGGYAAVQNISMEQLEDEVVETRLFVIKKYSTQNAIPKKDLLTAINCIELDCKSLDKCCVAEAYSPAIAHFEIPQIVNDLGEDSISYIGATDKQNSFKIYTDTSFKYHKYKTRGSKKPYVYIDTTPNENNLYDCYVFNAPMLERLTVIAIFKDPRQVEDYQKEHGCCDITESDNFTFLDLEIKDTLTKSKFQYYRQYVQQPFPNNQQPK